MIARLLRAVRMSPADALDRVVREARSFFDRWRVPRRGRLFGVSALLAACEAPSIDALWERLAAAPWPTWLPTASDADAIDAAERARVRTAAERAERHEVDLLGSGRVGLGARIDWHVDVRSGLAFPRAYGRAIDYCDLGRASDVKMPWEVSRLQWALPLGQAWRIERDDRWARAARDILEQWMEANPFGVGVSWAIAMEAAMRILAWTWLFHALADAPSWRDGDFRARFLCALYLHGEYTCAFFERADVNGNHCTADAAGLVFAGLFFGGGSMPRRWADEGWRILCEEMMRQVHDDGVNFEGSLAYHRLTLELFLLPALYRKARGLDVPQPYIARLRAMAEFSAVCSRIDGTVPWVGDADDGRALPLGGQSLHDHRYLAALVHGAFGGGVPPAHDGSEALWVLGSSEAELPPPSAPPASRAFPHGGFYIMRNPRDHVLIDCGPVGMAGRGGHGHNDCLAFDALLDGVHLVSDCGAYVYTASPAERNRFRSTASHNTPQIDGEEINRLDAASLWTLGDDARPQVDMWRTGGDVDVFEGRHSGYHRLPSPVTPVRRITLDHVAHALAVDDRFEGSGAHRVDVRLHLAPGVTAVSEGARTIRLAGRFLLAWEGEGWRAEIAASRVSPSYGVAVESRMIHWSREGRLGPLRFSIAPVRG